MLKDIHTNAFYRPLWRRLLILASTLIWLIVELWLHDPLWIPLAAATFAFCVYAMLLTYPKNEPPFEDVK